MSEFSGKCDLFNHIMSYKHRTKEGSDKKEDLEKARVLYSDEMECFKIFMERTGGVIHQHKRIHLDVHNQDFVASKCSALAITKHVKKSLFSRKEKEYYTYEYFGEKRTLKYLHKHGVIITVDIPIRNLLDLIPYYPYIISIACCNDGKDTIYISDQSYAEEEYNTHLQHGWENSSYVYYKEKLQDHYREVVLRYFNPTGRECIETLHFNSNRQTDVCFPIDKNFAVAWHFDGEVKTHWTSPQVVGERTIEISKEDYESYLGQDVKVYYVRYEEYPLYLD